VNGLENSPETFIAHALKLIRAAFPKSKIHVFGAGGTRTFPAVYALGADSGDSIGWRQAAGFGSIFLPMTSQRTVSWNVEEKPPRKLLGDSDFLQLAKCKCPICRHLDVPDKIDAFRRHFYNRAIHNAWIVLHQWQFWPHSRRNLLSDIANGTLGAGWADAVSSSR
jgi:hypothetical protein